MMMMMMMMMMMISLTSDQHGAISAQMQRAQNQTTARDICKLTQQAFLKENCLL
jgi:hypothetical protein